MLMKKMRLILILAALMCMFTAVTSHAATMDVMNFNYAQQVKIYHQAWGSYQWVSTGEFETLLEQSLDAIAYCVDIFQGVKYGEEWYGLISADQFTQSQQEAAWLLHAYAPGLGNDLTPGYSWSTSVAALQVAIWEVIYDESIDLRDGKFKISRYTDYGVKNLANTFLASIPTNISSSSIDFSAIYSSCRYQDLLNGAVASVATPEPASGILFASSLGIMGWWRRRKKAAGQIEEA